MKENGVNEESTLWVSGCWGDEMQREIETAKDI